MNSGLLLFDLDGTLIDESYRLAPGTQSHLINAIHHAQEEHGWLIGLNSDTPLAQLKKWHDLLKMNGPIIAENGCAVAFAPGAPFAEEREFLLVDAGLKIRIAELRSRLVQWLRGHERCMVIEGDATNIVRRLAPAGTNKHSISFDVLDDLIVVVNKYSLFSVRCFVRRIRKVRPRLGWPEVHRESTERVAAALASWLANDDPLVISEIEDTYGFLSLRERSARKDLALAAAVRYMGESALGTPAQVWVVGDSTNDLVRESLDGPSLTHWAVGNAHPDFLKDAEVRLSGSTTNGCLEVLHRIVRG